MSDKLKEALQVICDKVDAGDVTAQGIVLGVELAKAIIADKEADKHE